MGKLSRIRKAWHRMTDDEKQHFIRSEYSPHGFHGYFLDHGRIRSTYWRRSYVKFVNKLVTEYVAGLAHSDGIPTKGVSPSGQVGCGSPDDNGVQLPGPPSSPRRPDIQITYMTTGLSYKQVFKKPPRE